MIAAGGGTVTHLRRVQLGGLVLDPALEPGAYRALTAQEVELLMRQDG